MHMTHFRCYLLNARDEIVSVDSVEAANDAGAMELAGQLILAQHSVFAAIEVWDRARCVGQSSEPDPETQPAINPKDIVKSAPAWRCKWLDLNPATGYAIGRTVIRPGCARYCTSGGVALSWWPMAK
jgi:hypothetical protein